MTMKYDEQLDHILEQIVRDYQVVVEHADWATWLAHEKIQMLLTDHHLLVVVTSKPAADLKAAYATCCKLMTALYDFLVDRLFASIAGEAPTANSYEAADFLVLVFTAPAANVMEVIGQVVIPFVSDYYGQPLADSGQNQRVAAEVLERLFADPDDNQLRKGIIERLDALRIQQLQPLSLTRTHSSFQEVMESTQSVTVPNEHKDHQSTTAGAQAEPESDESTEEPHQSPDQILLGRSKTRRIAPLPDYFESDDSQS